MKVSAIVLGAIGEYSTQRTLHSTSPPAKSHNLHTADVFRQNVAVTSGQLKYEAATFELSLSSYNS